ncbi:MAG: 4Fe-4S dicluster domain-containing protein [Dehalococcoidales bacterium]
MKISRRDFIKMGAKGLLGGMLVYNMPPLLRQFMQGEFSQPAAAANYSQYDLEKHYWGFVCDNEKCIGCGRCVVACKLENKVPWKPEYNRTWVERYVITADGEIFVDSPNAGRDGFTAKYQGLEVWKSFFVPKLCNQCDNPPCVTVCPVGATYQTDDGVILIDQDRCIGCRYCIQACPYGARFFLPEKGVVDKCTWCYHRITHGLVPACMEVCPVGARVFGDLHDPEGQVTKILRERHVYVLKPDLGTEPKVYYIGFEKGVH